MLPLLLGGLTGLAIAALTSDDSDSKKLIELSERFDDLLTNEEYEEALSVAEEIKEYDIIKGQYSSALVHYRIANNYYDKADDIINGIRQSQEEDEETDFTEEKKEAEELLDSAIHYSDLCIDEIPTGEEVPSEFDTLLYRAYYLKASGIATSALYINLSASAACTARQMFMVLMDGDDDLARSAHDYYSYLTTKIIDHFNHFYDLYAEYQHYKNDPQMFNQEDYEDECNDWENNFLPMYVQELFCNEIPFHERQFIFIAKNENSIAGCVDEEKNINWVFTPDKLPADISFPAGHPVGNTLYIAHIAKKGHYLPYEGAEDLMFYDKIEDFCTLLQCLGAEEITFKHIKGIRISETELSSTNIKGNGSIKVAKGSFDYSDSTSRQSNRSSSKEVMFSTQFNPKKKPYVPEHLDWLEADESWQKLVKQRLDGNLITYTKKISSSETTNLSSNQKKSIKASFQYLMSKADINYDKNTDRTFSNSTTTEWEISVKFKPLEDIEYIEINNEVNDNTLKLNESKRLTQSEQTYKEEVEFYLEDGEIGEFERKALNRMMKKLGISKERASEIEAMCRPALSEEEKKYLEIFKEISEDGEITPRKRKILMREAKCLGITEEKVKAIEEIII